MTHSSTDPRAIEADLERDRASLASTLDALSDRVSVDNLAKEALGMITSRAGAYTSTIDTAVRANPLALALIGAGVAWMVLGPRGRSDDASSAAPMGHPTHDELPRWESEGGNPPDMGSIAYRPTSSGNGASVTYGASAAGADGDWHQQATGLRARASAALARIESEAKSYYASMRDGIGSGLGGARDFAAEKASVVSSFTSDLKERLSHGLEDLSEVSRDRILAARERAYAAGIRSDSVTGAIRHPGRALEDHPLIAGAVAFALGAAVAAMLPRTETEDRAFGSERDRLLDEAGRMLRTERERAMQIAGSLGSELKAAAQETFESVADNVTQAAGRVTDRVTDEVASARPVGQAESVTG